MISQSFRDFSVQKKNQLIFITILFITLCCYGLVFFFSSKQKSDALLVDISGKNRMLSQRIGAMSQLVGCADDELSDKAKEELKKAVNAHDTSLKALKEGGFLPGIESELPAATGKIKDKITEIQEFFQGHKNIAETLISTTRNVEIASDSGKAIISPNPIFEKSLKEMQKRLINGTLLKHNVELTTMFVEKANDTKESFMNLLFGLLILNILTLITGYRLLHKYVTIPVKYLSGISSKIANGDAGVQSTYESKDDIGRISNSINILTGNLRKAANFTMKLGKGEFTAQLDMVIAENTAEEQNLALSLMNMKSSLIEIASLDKKRKWVAEGLAGFGENIRNNHDIKSFSDVVVKELVKYVGATQAGLFVLNTDGKQPVLELTACYAYERKKYMEKIIEPGEGLIGQAYLEQEKIYLTDVPENFAAITSGLGTTKPTCVLILPLKNNNQIEGVFEISSLKPFDEFEIQFLEKASETIGSSLYHLKVNDRTRKLLEESQQQGEELRAQEEEMRQNMEELSATQEEIARKETQYLELIDQLRSELDARKAA